MSKRLLSIPFLCAIFFVSCSQSNQKAGKEAHVTASKVKTKSEGAACCVSKVPSRFTIVKTTDTVSAKKTKNN